MNIVVYARLVKPEQEESVCRLLEMFAGCCERILLFSALHPYVEKLANSYKDKIVLADESYLGKNMVDYCIALGGDGSFLDIAVQVASYSIPVLGINFGRLGFLTDVSIDKVKPIVEKLIHRDYTIEERFMLQLASDCELNCFGGKKFALNEITLARKDISTLISIDMSIDGKHAHTYWADGVIISTPTGSTGYNLSCNGPIVFPSTPCIIITPYASHNLNVRPLVLPENVVLSFRVSCRTSTEFICMLDARREELHTEQVLTVKKNDFPVKLIKTNDFDFINALVEKLHWGLDLRNK